MKIKKFLFGNNFFIAFMLLIIFKITPTFSSACDPQPSVFEKTHQAEAGFQSRWDAFIKTHQSFAIWKSDWKEEELSSRFEEMKKERRLVYFDNPEDFGKKGFSCRWKQEYQMPDTFLSWSSRYPYPIAPVYTLADPNYNASMISLHGLHFLAVEAPCEKNLEVFLSVLDQFKVTDLVRLTPQVYKNREGSFPYWEGVMNIHSIDGHPSIKIASREIHYFPLDLWEDHQGIEPEKLLALVKAVKNSKISDPKMIAVHCRAGVGRTGAFIAAYTLMHDIDEQIARGVGIDEIKVSIDKIIWEISLQRPFAVTHFPQYVALYKFVGYYLDVIRKNHFGAW